jgi:DNA-binding transcriptional regulator YbjK
VKSAASDTRAASRRDEVLDAALRVMARDGIRAVTHRAIAAELGHSLRATTYYFASIDELIEAVFLRYVQRSLVRFAEIEDALPTTGLTVQDGARALAAVVVSDLLDDRDGLVAEYHVVLEAARRPSLSAAYASWQAALERALIKYATSLGSEAPAHHAKLVLATLRGLELAALAQPHEPVVFEEIERVFATLLDAIGPVR